MHRRERGNKRKRPREDNRERERTTEREDNRKRERPTEREGERERMTEKERERDSLLPVEAVHEAHFSGFQIFYWSSHGASLLLLLDLRGLITFTAFTVITTRAQMREGERERERERGRE